MKETTYCVTVKKGGKSKVNLIKSKLSKELIEMYLKESATDSEIISVRKATANEIKASMPIIKMSITSEIERL